VMTFNDGLYIQSMELVYSVKLPLSMNTLSIVHPTLLTNIARKTPPPSIHGPSIDVDVTMQPGFDTIRTYTHSRQSICTSHRKRLYRLPTCPSHPLHC
jgi:hypothetical protein